ncbi:Ig-like domain-containing protein [Paenibacillus sp. YPG26]|uniref:Ig-like domain-containing protein n=1 Tax=Paenibacillus sp. YPG26 TaxID=2878915 RepID=UPI00203D0F05|nr:Ig-like domain-containing protein [Paenibacillus sp. YPG26]USB32448.1 Ig-like domain-containing protein [Paenibacillus sp. YPG26]
MTHFRARLISILLIASVLLLSPSTFNANISSASSISPSAPPLEQDWTKLTGSQENYNSAVKAAATRDGGVILLGSVTSRSTFEHEGLIIQKLNKQGELEWERMYNESTLQSGDYLIGQDIRQTRDGGYIIGGQVSLYPVEGKAFLVKLGPEGQYEWSKVYISHFWNEDFERVRETKDGNFIASVRTWNRSDTSTPAAFLTDSKGNQLWYKKLPAYEGQDFRDVIELPSGSYLATGLTERKNAVQVPVLILINPKGELADKLYVQGSNGSHPAVPLQLEQLPAAKSYIARTASSLQNITASGKVLWELPFSSLPDGELTHYSQLSIASDGAPILIGSSNTGTSIELRILKVSSTGEFLWSYHTPILNLESIALGEATPDGGVAVSYTTPNSGQIGVIKLKVSESPGSGEGSLYLDSDEYSITLGDTFDLRTLYKDSSGIEHNVTTEAEYKSSNPDVVSVDLEGNITGINPGTATLTVSYKGLTYSCPVLVVKPYTPAQAEQ